MSLLLCPRAYDWGARAPVPLSIHMAVSVWVDGASCARGCQECAHVHFRLWQLNLNVVPCICAAYAFQLGVGQFAARHHINSHGSPSLYLAGHDHRALDLGNM